MKFNTELSGPIQSLWTFTWFSNSPFQHLLHFKLNPMLPSIGTCEAYLIKGQSCIKALPTVAKSCVNSLPAMAEPCINALFYVITKKPAKSVNI